MRRSGALEKLELGLRMVADAVADLEREDDWVDQSTSPLVRRAYLRAARDGEFPTKKVGRQVLARRSDVDAFIVRNGKAPKPKQQDDNDAREVANVLRFRARRRRS